MADPRARPIVVGGSGGSGTRVVAEILIRSDVFMGRDLNRASDDQIFTFLFKHPYRFARFTNVEAPQYGDFQELFDLHRRLLLGERPLPEGSGRLLLRSAWDHIKGRYSLPWAVKRLLGQRYRLSPTPRHWGFKEPHTMYFLHGLSRAYPRARYVHVIRNGLDMTFSRNQQDFVAWGPHYGIDPSRPDPAEVFEFWYRSNLEAMTLGSEWLGERFLVVRLEDLCSDPEQWISAILEHTGLEPGEVPADLLGLPRVPSSDRRFLQHDTAWIDSAVDRKLARLGYSLNELFPERAQGLPGP